MTIVRMADLVEKLRDAAQARFIEPYDRYLFGPPASEDEIAELEAIVVGRLPEEYRAFLSCARRLETNDVTIFSPIQVAMIYRGSEVPQRLLIGPPHLLAEDEVVPVAGDGGGDMFILGTRGPNAGRVWIWSHEAVEPIHGSASSGYEPHADTFGDFITRLSEEWSK